MGFYSYFLLGQVLGVEWEDTENKLISASFVGPQVPLSRYIYKKNTEITLNFQEKYTNHNPIIFK